MTITEFNNEFDILYDNIASKGAPGIDLYEKSVYLTTAQLEIIKNYYNPTSNIKKESFESSEKRRVDLKELITNYSVTTPLEIEEGISTDSIFFNIPSNVFIPINERVLLEHPCNFEKVINTRDTKVIPITHDEYNIQINNPFRSPDSNTVWRLDYHSLNDLPVVELISLYQVKKYILRYIKFPSPIILTDLNSGNFEGMNLTIEGETSEQTCKLNTELHREILNRAVELATRDYKENNLQNKIQTNLRNE